MAKEEFDPVKAGQEEAAKNAKADKKATALKGELVAIIEEAQTLSGHLDSVIRSLGIIQRDTARQG